MSRGARRRLTRRWDRGSRREAASKARDGRLETRSVLRIVRSLGKRVALHVWFAACATSSITAALDAAGKAGIGPDKVKAQPARGDRNTANFTPKNTAVKGCNGRWPIWSRGDLPEE
jgi:hypothetical protein